MEGKEKGHGFSWTRNAVDRSVFDVAWSKLPCRDSGGPHDFSIDWGEFRPLEVGAVDVKRVLLPLGFEEEEFSGRFVDPGHCCLSLVTVVGISSGDVGADSNLLGGCPCRRGCRCLMSAWGRHFEVDGRPIARRGGGEGDWVLSSNMSASAGHGALPNHGAASVHGWYIDRAAAQGPGVDPSPGCTGGGDPKCFSWVRSHLVVRSGGSFQGSLFLFRPGGEGGGEVPSP